jgi:hypothetical protein
MNDIDPRLTPNARSFLEEAIRDAQIESGILVGEMIAQMLEDPAMLTLYEGVPAPQAMNELANLIRAGWSRENLAKSLDEDDHGK